MNQRNSIPDRILQTVRPVIQLMCFALLMVQLMDDRWGNVYLCVLTLVFLELPRWTRRISVILPAGMELMILLFLFGSSILGEIGAWYIRIPWWDGLLHGVSGFLFAAVGYFLPEALDRRGSTATVRLLCAVCLSVAVSVLWEFLEWGVDGVFGLDMQKDTVISGIRSVCLDPRRGNCACGFSGIRDTAVLLADGTAAYLGLGGYLDIGLHDTMGDLLVNLAGACAFLFFAGGNARIMAFFLPIMANREGER